MKKIIALWVAIRWLGVKRYRYTVVTKEKLIFQGDMLLGEKALRAMQKSFKSDSNNVAQSFLEPY